VLGGAEVRVFGRIVAKVSNYYKEVAKVSS